MGIRTKHFGASFEAGLEAGLEGLKAMEIGENNGPQNVRKSGRAKMGLPSSVEAKEGERSSAQLARQPLS